jgi:hypothetical protein
MVFKIGAVSDPGRKVMLECRRSESREVSQYYLSLCAAHVPTLAWTRVPLFGKLAGRLLNPGEIRKEGLLALTPSPSAALKPQP